MEKLRINGILVDPESDDLKGVKDAKGVSKLGIFDHFNETAKADSEKQLLAAINGEGKKEEFSTPVTKAGVIGLDTKVVNNPPTPPAGK